MWRPAKRDGSQSSAQRLGHQPVAGVRVGEHGKGKVALTDEEEPAMLAIPVAAMLDDPHALGAGPKLEGAAGLERQESPVRGSPKKEG